MKIATEHIELMSEGHGKIIDLTGAVSETVHRSGMVDGIVTVFSPSSTSALTTIEYEAGCISDLQRLFDEVVPPDRPYAHNARWGDGNGHSHVRAALLGPSLTVPFADGRLTLGTWQQIIFADFDNRPRRRQLVLKLIGQ